MRSRNRQATITAKKHLAEALKHGAADYRRQKHILSFAPVCHRTCVLHRGAPTPFTVAWTARLSNRVRSGRYAGFEILGDKARPFFAR
jgi:hypothetical protein